MATTVEIARYWSKIDVRGPSECWPWTRGTTSGRVTYGQYHAGGTFLAHRFGYELANGPIPKGLEISHSCDYGLCQNPTHLTATTHARNETEKDERGRRPTGTTGTPCKKCGGPRDHEQKRGSGRSFYVCHPCYLAYQRAYRSRAC